MKDSGVEWLGEVPEHWEVRRLKHWAKMNEDVPPHENAFYDLKNMKTGYGISFTRYFYRPQPLYLLENIRPDILEIKKESEWVLGEILRREK